MSQASPVRYVVFGGYSIPYAALCAAAQQADASPLVQSAAAAEAALIEAEQEREQEREGESK
jgi:hypothetical protein